MSTRAKGRPGEITRLLREWVAGGQEAADELLRRVYPELRWIASNRLAAERRVRTLGVTALVHEAYLRLAEVEALEWRDRAHFFAFASTVVRRVLVDYARRSRADKRGGGDRPLPLEGIAEIRVHRSPDVVEIDAALADLERHDPLQARIVEQRFFGGLTHEEIATVLDCSPATVYRQWRLARAWLYGRLETR